MANMNIIGQINDFWPIRLAQKVLEVVFYRGVIENEKEERGREKIKRD